MSFSLPGNEHLFATALSLARHAAWASTADGSLVGGGHAKRLRSLGSRVSWPQDWCIFMWHLSKIVVSEKDWIYYIPLVMYSLSFIIIWGVSWLNTILGAFLFWINR